MADLKKTVEILFEGNDQASRKAADVIAQIKALDTQAKDAAAGTEKLTGSLEKVGATEKAISAAATAMAAFAGKLVTDRFIEVNTAVERFELGIRAIQGPTNDAGREFEFVSTLANRLGLSLIDAAGSYVSLTAATKGTALEGAQTREIFEAVARAASALGKSTSDTEGILRALEQIVSKGKVSMEELRQQLGDRLPGAMQIAARAMGVTTGELEDLTKKGLAAEVFLPRFADELNRTFGGASFDGYTQNLNRLRNAFDEMLVQLGKSGAFDGLTGVLKDFTDLAKRTGVEFQFVTDILRALGRVAQDDDGFKTLASDFENAQRKSAQLTAEIEFGINQTLAETARLSRQMEEALRTAFSGDQTDAETARLQRQANALGDGIKAAGEYDKLLKRLGVDPKKTTEGIEQLARDLKSLSENPKTNGELFSQAFETALKRVQNPEQLKILKEALREAFDSGRISADVFADGLADVDRAYDKLTGKANENAKALKKHAEETKRAEENAQKFRIELEKIASNERIKIIEARVTLDVAKIEAQTKQVEAAFESINTTVESTGDLISDLFGLFKDEDKLSFRALHTIEKQIDLENQRRQEALNLQKDLVRAQIENLRAQTQSLNRGNPLIQIDGTGLQPHLEAFMWEILKAIQVRVNEDGLDMLLGTH